MVSFRLEPEMENRLTQLASLTKRSKSSFIKEALKMHLDDLEDAYISLNRIASPNRALLSTDDVLKQLDD